LSAEIAVRPPQHMSLPDKITYAKALADSNLLPPQYRKNPANLLFALEYADALGVAPIHAITSIHVIEGKPSASADLIGTMVRRAGHKLRITGDDTHAVAQIIRADDPEFTFEARWDMAKARAAGLTNKSVWKNYPGAMLRARAITEVARAGAPDALFGVQYTPEELGAEVDSEGTVISVPSSRGPAEPRAEEQRLIDQTPAKPAPEVVVARLMDATTPEAVETMLVRLEQLAMTDEPVEVNGVPTTLGDLARGRHEELVDAMATLRPPIEVPVPDEFAEKLIEAMTAAVEPEEPVQGGEDGEDASVDEPPEYWGHTPDNPDDCRVTGARTGVLKTLEDMGVGEADLAEYFGRPVATVATKWLRDRVKTVIQEQRAAAASAS
jgi:hypothetical protein